MRVGKGSSMAKLSNTTLNVGMTKVSRNSVTPAQMASTMKG
jgi:hypothetical protein